MNPLYEKIAKGIKANTLPSAFTKLEADVVDKDGLVKALSDYFSEIDVLFSPAFFALECGEVK